MFANLVSGIKAVKEACYALLKELNQTLTMPSDDPKLNPRHKYTLRGVIPSPDVLYLCRRKQTPTFELPDDDDDEWWRITWVPEADNPVQQEVCAYRYLVLTRSPGLIFTNYKANHD